VFNLQVLFIDMLNATFVVPISLTTGKKGGSSTLFELNTTVWSSQIVYNTKLKGLHCYKL